MSPARAVALGALTVGTLDALDAIVFFGARGVAPIRIFQSIASGLLGRASFQGGLPTAALGVLLHFTIALGIVSVFYTASRRLPMLIRQPLIWGPVYGILVYCFMNYVVIPLSAAGSAPHAVPVILNGIGIHILGVGLPSVLFARAAARTTSLQD